MKASSTASSLLTGDARLASLAFVFSASVLGSSGFDELRHERGRKRLVGCKLDRTLADFVVLQFSFVSAHHGRALDVESAVGGRGPVAHEILTVELEHRNSVVDALGR